MNSENLPNRKRQDFWALVNKSGGTNACWEWCGSRFTSGYGTARLDGKNVQAHRVAYFLASGARVPADLVVMHSCDNKPCVNPSHLSIGTQLENVRDCQAKGRQAKGEQNGRSKLTERDVIEIAVLLTKQTISCSEIGRAYGVAHSTVTAIRDGKTYGYLTGFNRKATR